MAPRQSRAEENLLSSVVSQQRVLSGMRPTGRLHLGHYHGVLKNWVKLQHEYPCLFFVADILAGAPVLTAAGPAYTWLAGLGTLVTLVYGVSILVRAERDYFRFHRDRAA